MKINCNVSLVPGQENQKVSELQLPIKLKRQCAINFEVNTGVGENFHGQNVLEELVQPVLEDPGLRFESASQRTLALGSVMLQTEIQQACHCYQQGALDFIVTGMHDLNILNVRQLNN